MQDIFIKDKQTPRVAKVYNQFMPFDNSQWKKRVVKKEKIGDIYCGIQWMPSENQIKYLLDVFNSLLCYNINKGFCINN